MKKSILIAILAIFVGFTARAVRHVETAAHVMGACAAKIDKAPSVSAKFTLTAGGQKLACALTVAKQKYAMVTPQVRIWYNGLTQWVYNSQTHEVTVSEPTSDEIMETNPFSILNSYAKAYDCRLLKAQPGEKVVELTPKNTKNASVRTATVHIDSKTSLPTKITVTMPDGKVVNAQVTSCAVGKALPPQAFMFNKADYKISETIDLR